MSQAYSGFQRTVTFSLTIPEINGLFKPHGPQLCSVSLLEPDMTVFHIDVFYTFAAVYGCVCSLVAIEMRGTVQNESAVPLV